jgi:hypothetical protein
MKNHLLLATLSFISSICFSGVVFAAQCPADMKIADNCTGKTTKEKCTDHYVKKSGTDKNYVRCAWAANLCTGTGSVCKKD